MIKDIHFYMRWIVLIFMAASIIYGFRGWIKGRQYKKGIFAAAVGVLHIQIILGLILYVQNVLPMFGNSSVGEIMKNAEKRFLAVEHISLMLIAGIVATVGYSWGKRAARGPLKFKRTTIMYIFALVLILAAIPWHKPLI